MDRRAKDGLRAGATAVGVAAGLMVLASTAQTPDGFVRASLGGPLAPFGIGNTTTSDVLSIGDGASDTSELAALLKGSAPNTGGGPPDSPYRAAFEAGATPGVTAPKALLDTDPIGAPAPITDVTQFPAPKSVVDSQGRVDCTGSVSCETDPVTQVTTVTYPDGVVAIIQKVNDLTVVAYKTLTEYLPPSVQTLLPPVPAAAPPVVAAPPPPMASTPAPSPQPETPAVAAPPTQDETVAPVIDPGPPDPDLLDPSDSRRGPRVNVTRPPMDFSPGSGLDGPGTPNGPNNNFPGLGKVKDALDSVVDAVGDAVGKAIGPGASSKVSRDETRPAGPSGPSADDAGQP